ncbi:hypothetical protein NA57DRAFT_58640 [Rhizodiscina lignyota]|uniref:Uncharacterized protein n=1 Tax=Rhizodiscina lignyota TaxID=1504668 RepID=A0A9P4ICH8_9PEZI|nr:hypothetical protein NA57DRAFT_58640 [Rhizodiscina lignyota]
MPSINRIMKPQCRHFHPSPPSRALSPLFALQALANSRETQHFNKASGLSRVDHSPNLELLRSSEVDPFKRKPPPPPDTRKPYTVEQQQAQVKNDAIPKVIPSVLANNQLSSNFSKPSSSPSGTSSTDAAALDVGRALMASHAAERDTLRESLRLLEHKQDTNRKAWKNERKELLEKIDRFEGRESLAANVVLAGVFIGVIWWFKPRFEHMMGDKQGWNRDGVRQKMEDRWNDAKAMTTTRRKEQYSALQPTAAKPVLVTAENNAAPIAETAKGSSGWFWR